jgi:hypothetical protein
MLGGFAKIHVGAHASATVDVGIAARNLAHWVPKDNAHVVDGGAYSIFVCHDSRGLGRGSDAKNAEGLPAEAGQCMQHTVTLE